MEKVNKPDSHLEYLTSNETNALLQAIADPRDYAIVAVFLTTGIFLNELAELETSSIDWDKKFLKISGSRTRQLPLNDQAYEAVAKWSRERPDSPACSIFFTTTKGKLKGLSARSIDHLIRKYSEQAGLTKKVTAQILRNTFAVKLFSQEITLHKAGEVLGIVDYHSLSRYQVAAKQPPQESVSTIKQMEVTDTRSASTKLLQKIFSTKPKPAKPTSQLKGQITTNPEEYIIGRDHVIADLRAAVNKNQSVLVTGQLGTGKTHFLRHMAKVLEPDSIYFAAPSPVKNILIQICQKLELDWKKELKSRASAKELSEYIQRVNPNKKLILVIDNLHTLKASDIDTIHFLIKKFCILGSTEELTPRLKALWYEFRQEELQPLTQENAKELIKYLTANMAISDYELMETKILSLSNNLPLAIVDMVKQLSYKPVVTREAVRDIYHDAGTKYRDWTSAVIVLWAAMTVFRFIALGTHSFEGYILAGFGMAVMIVMRYFLFKMR